MKNSVWCAELVCSAVFENDTLSCLKPPHILPIAATHGDTSNCAGPQSFLSFNVGPHDARIFYGPRSPYAIYGSNSQYTCFGQWAMDFRMLFDWGAEPHEPDQFIVATEIHRPPPIGTVEKNFFLFWDSDDKLYAHYSIYPQRNFAALSWDGSAGPDISALALYNDEKCMTQYMPHVGEKWESIHQATNSLSITLCARADPACIPSDANTFIFVLFQHKSYYWMHGVYEPYAMLFSRSAPFAIHGISTRPLWFAGRGRPGQWTQPRSKPQVLRVGEKYLDGQTEMFYVTSVSWRRAGQKYHGYVDDVMFIGFGIEDSATGGIDVVAGDLLQDLSLCGDL